MSNYIKEKNVLVNRLDKILPYGKRWLESKPLHVLIALYNKSTTQKGR